MIGILWSILGVFTLSYIAMASEKLQGSILRLAALIYTYLVVLSPIGILVGALFASNGNYPSAKVAGLAGAYLLLPGLLSVFFFEDFVQYPKFHFAASNSRRVTFMGGYFVIAGLFVQLFAGVFDLLSFNG